MIKATELRIGNWVKALPYWEDDDAVPQSPYELVRVVALDPDMLFSDKKVWFENGDSEDYTDIIGISLTPEILEKAGFVNNPDSDFNCIKIGNHTYLSCGDNAVWIDRQVRSELYSVGVRGVEHLHQLQNLYFALTGEELNIELAG